MKFSILNETKNRLRIHMTQSRMTMAQADILQYYLENCDGVVDVKVHDRTCDAVIIYEGDRAGIIDALRQFGYDRVEIPADLTETSGRTMNRQYEDKLFWKTVWYMTKKWIVPMPLRYCLTSVKALKYIGKGLKCLADRKLEVPVLDATAITASILTNDFATAGSVMFLLEIGEILEEWTHKKSVGGLARSMALNINKVWVRVDDCDVLMDSAKIAKDDLVVVHMSNVIPFDGIVAECEGMVNQSSLTGESVPVHKGAGDVVYAGTVVEEGELVVRVTNTGRTSRYDKVVAMIEESEKLKSGLESKAEHLADGLVPWTLGGTILTYLLTRNITKMLAVLMVDYSCALKMSMPIAVLSAIQEANKHHLTVKGGKFLEAVAEADTIVFDKTGTLTKASPTLVRVVPFDGRDPDELLKIAACLEEHFPHSMARAVVAGAAAKGIEHEEMHSKVDYIVAHGIASYIGDERVIIGSNHFVFEDEKCVIPESEMDKFDSLPPEYSHLYLAIGGRLAAVICIEDPLRPESTQVIKELRKLGISKIVMMTGDSDRTAKAIAAKVGVDEYYSEVLPEDKANFVEKEKAEGRKVIMIGDGINDSPALSAANVGIAISEGAQIAREIADITISEDALYQLVTLKEISNRLMKRVHWNYRFVIGFNLGLILLGVAGVIAPATSALLHNTSTLGISLKSMTNLLNDSEKKKEYEEAEA